MEIVTAIKPQAQDCIFQFQQDNEKKDEFHQVHVIRNHLINFVGSKPSMSMLISLLLAAITKCDS